MTYILKIHSFNRTHTFRFGPEQILKIAQSWTHVDWMTIEEW